MTTYLIDLLGISTWQLIFSICFFFSLFYFILFIAGAVGHHQDDFHHDKVLPLDKDGVDHLGSLDHDIDAHDLHFDHVELDKSFEVEKQDMVIKSSYKMGNIASFLFFFGMSGWITGENIQDYHILISIGIGLLVMRLFAYVIANYTKTVIVPLKYIEQGDVGIVVFSVTPEKPGRVLVTRKDGTVSTIMARGMYPHDYFGKEERGYIMGKNSRHYFITRGVVGQPDLETTKKKAMDQIDTLE